jgi:hypothetical protein
MCAAREKGLPQQRAALLQREHCEQKVGKIKRRPAVNDTYATD